MTRPVLGNIQILRLAAAASVLLMHSADLLISRKSAFFAVPWGSGVDMFFVISGFIMTWLTAERFGQPHQSGRFLLRRLLRIVPPYWFFTTVMVAATLLATSHVHQTTAGAAELLTSYAFVPWPRPSDGRINPILSQGWTLNYEMAFYVVFAIALRFRHGLRWLAVGLVMLAACSPLVPPDWFALRFYSDPIILDFVAGIALAVAYLRGVRLTSVQSVALVVAAVGVCLTTQFTLPKTFVSGALQTGFPATLLVASLALRAEPAAQGWLRRTLQHGGDASYTLYLCHPFTANVVVILWRRAAGGWNPWVGVLAAMVVSVATAMLFYEYVERRVTQRLNRAFDLRTDRKGARLVRP